MAQIFISYALEDGKAVQQLYQQLKDAGYSPWMDKVDLIGGQLWQPAIEKAIENSDFFIICLSSNSVKKRGFVQHEIRVALELWQKKLPDDVFLIPVKLESLDRDAIPREIAKFQWVDWHEDYGWQQLTRSLEHGIQQRGIKSRQQVVQSQAQVLSVEPAKTDHQPLIINNELQTYEFTTVTLDALGNVIKQQQKQAPYLIEASSWLNLEMTYLSGGKFYMGLNASEEDNVKKEIERYWRGGGDWPKTEMPQHTVKVPPFFLGKYPITQAQWRFIARTPKIDIDLALDPSNFKGDTLSVDQISWDDGQEFCARLSRETNKLYRLPTEAEWEFACRGGTSTPFSFGETITPEIVNYDGNGPYAKARKWRYRKQTIPVGELGFANPFGIFDMHGNIWEWCQDRWHENYEHAPQDGSAWETGDRDFRVLRGGSWNIEAFLCRSANRFRLFSGSRDKNLGLRVVLQIEMGAEFPSRQIDIIAK